MKGARARRVGKRKYNQIVNEEIAKIEESRPARVRRNGVEIKASLQEEYVKDKEEMSTTSKPSKRPFTKFGSLKVSYFNKPCIYMLYKGEQIVYVGQTECLARRVAEHMQSDKDFDSFVIHSFVDDQYIRLKKEEILIRKYKPKYNSIHK
jgi:hypothetical protein